MRKGWLIMIICLMMTLNGCSVEKNIVSENNNEILQLEVDKEGAIIIKEEYPKLKVSVELFNEGMKEKLKEMKEKYETEVYCSVSIQRADAYTLSFFAKYCIEDNGNTICQMMETWNYNTETGSFINLEDVFIDGTKLQDMLQTQLMNDCVLKDNSDNVDEQIKSALSDERELKWTIGYQGITFYIPILFVEGEEIVPIVFLFSEYPEIFVDKVKNVPKEYSFDMDNAGNFNYDIDDNGEIEKITVRYCYNELCDIPYMSSVQISVDENNYVSVIDEGIFSRFSRGYLLHIEDKEYVLVYIETLYDNMGNYLIFDLNSGEVVENEMLYFYLENNRITNPNKIAVEVRMDPVTGGIATLDGYWRVNESGILSEKEDMTYVYHSGTICENNKELELIAIDSTTGECIEQKFILGKGNQFELLKTDGHTWCDILLEDGRSGRVVFDEYVEIDETPKVNGERIPIQWIPR